MKAVFGAAGFALGASAAILPRQQCCFSLTASGGTSGSVSQLSDGQNRIGGNGPAASYCMNNGQITDGNGRGCILTAPTTQFQCDTGASASGGFSVSSSGQLQSGGSGTFYACPATDNGEYNIYTSPVSGQSKCVQVSLSTGGQCSGSSSGSASGTPPAASTPVVSTASVPPSSAPPPASVPPSSAPPPASVPPSSAPPPSSVPPSSAPPPSSVPPSSAPPPASVPPSSAPPPSSPPAVGSSHPAPPHKSSVPAVSVPPVHNTPATVHHSTPVASTPVASVPPANQGCTCPPAVTVTVVSTPPVVPSQPPVVTNSVPVVSTSVVVSTVPSVPASTAPVPPASTPVVSVPASSPPPASTPVVSVPASSPPPVSSAPPPANSAPPPSSAPPASNTQPAPSSSASACQTSLTGNYQAPHLIVPVCSTSPNTAYGSQYSATVNITTSTIFNFDIPASYAGKQCSLIFLLPQQSQLTTSSYTLSSTGGSLTFEQLSGAATTATTYANAPSVDTALSQIEPQPGNSYVVASSSCAAGTTQSFAMSTSGEFSLNFFEDYNPAALGLYITAC